MKTKRILSFIVVLLIAALCPTFVGCNKGENKLSLSKAEKELAQCCFEAGYERTTSTSTSVSTILVRRVGGKINANLGEDADGVKTYVKDGVVYSLAEGKLERADTSDAEEILAPIASPFEQSGLACSVLEETGAKKVTKKTGGGTTTYSCSGTITGGTKISALVTLKNKKLASVEVEQEYEGGHMTTTFEAYDGEVDFGDIDFGSYSWEMSKASFCEWASEHLEIAFDAYESNVDVGDALIERSTKVKREGDDLIMADIVSINDLQMASYLVGDTFYYEQYTVGGRTKNSAVRGSERWQEGYDEASMYLANVTTLFNAENVSGGTLTVEGSREVVTFVETKTEEGQTTQTEFTIVIEDGELVSVAIADRLLGADTADVCVTVTRFAGDIELPDNLNEQNYPLAA